MRIVALLLLLAVACTAQTAAPPPAPAQIRGPEHEAVRRAVIDYIEGFYEGDTTKFVRSVRPEVFKFGFWIPPSRDSSRTVGYVGEQMQWSEFHAFANDVKASGRLRPASDPREVIVYDVLDQIASAKVVAYWGVDYVLLAKFGGRWMITHVLWQTPPRR